MARRLTETFVRNRTKPGEDADTERPGLRLRVTENGRKVWYFRYRDGDKLKKLKLGEWPNLSLASARDEALSQRALLDQGKDPQFAREAAREAEKQAREEIDAAEQEDLPATVGELVAEYLTYADRTLKPATVKDYRRYLEGEVVQRWESRPAIEIRRGEVVDLLDAVSVRGHRAAGHLLTGARACWAWALERERVELNPWAGLKRQARKFKGGTRKRELPDKELRVLLLELSESRLSARVQNILRLMLATGCRPGEAAAARWTEFDPDAGWWTIPESRTKTGKTYRIPLTPRVMALLETIKAGQCRGRHRYLFPSQRKHPRVPHVRTDGLANRLRRVGFEFAPHDLRRTVSTGLQRLGCPVEVRDRILNHAGAEGVRKHYDHHEFDDEAREWLGKWCRHLDTLEAENVVRLSTRQ